MRNLRVVGFHLTVPFIHSQKYLILLVLFSRLQRIRFNFRLCAAWWGRLLSADLLLIERPTGEIKATLGLAPLQLFSNLNYKLQLQQQSALVEKHFSTFIFMFGKPFEAITERETALLVYFNKFPFNYFVKQKKTKRLREDKLKENYIGTLQGTMK